MRPQGPIRALIIDDGPVFRRSLAEALGRQGDLHALMCSGAHQDVRSHLLQMHPELILLALNLRTNDSLRLLERLRQYYPVPVLVFGDDHEVGREQGLRATELGALEILVRPRRTAGPELERFAGDVALRIRAAVSNARPVARPPMIGPNDAAFSAAGLNPLQSVVVVGASTGGTEAIAALLRSTPADFPPVVIVQHMPVGFTGAFASRLNGISATQVSEARDGQPLHAGCGLLARGDTHLVLRAAGAGWIVRYTDRRPVNRHCPSVDVLFESAAYAAGARGVGVLLTGMGADGAAGLLKMRQAGALTLAQDKPSCVVYGMPKEAVALGAVVKSAPPNEIPSLITRLLVQRREAGLASAPRR